MLRKAFPENPKLFGHSFRQNCRELCGQSFPTKTVCSCPPFTCPSLAHAIIILPDTGQVCCSHTVQSLAFAAREPQIALLDPLHQEQMRDLYAGRSGGAPAPPASQDSRSVT